jgi:ribosomal protein S18 acetylase RimI-like enzyme
VLKALKHRLFRILGKDPEAVIVSFRAGDPALADAMCAEIRRLEPSRRHFEVTLEEAAAVRRNFRRYRIGLAPVLFTDDPQYQPLRRAAFLLAPRKILAYNQRLERHHLRLKTPIASWLFLRGVPLDRIFLRPKWLVPLRKDRTIRPATHRVIEGQAHHQGRPSVAILSPYFPFPLSHGGAVRIFNLLREMAREFEITLYAFTEGDIGTAELAPVLPLVSKVCLVQKPRYREPRWSTLAPPETSEYDSPAMRKLWQARQADVAQVEYTYLAAYGGDILVEHDVTFDLHAQVLARRKTFSAWWDWWRWRRFELRAVRHYKQVVVMSDKDRELLRTAHVTVIENGVDLNRFDPTPEEPGRRLLFIGSFRHFPNIVAFQFLMEKIFPHVPDAELTVVAGPEPLLHWRNHTGTLHPPKPPRIRLLEFVEDVRPLYGAANVVVIPTLESAGTNLKVLEALAMERAVASTPSGVAGLRLEHGATAWIAQEGPDLAAGIVKLLDEGALRTRIAQAGRIHVKKHFDWRAIGRRQRALLRERTGDPLIFRPAVADDLNAIAHIQAASPSASQWEPDDYLSLDCLVAALRQNGRLAGFVVSRGTGPGEREILNLAVDPGLRRRGVGLRLLETELNRGEGAWFLEVRESNRAAIQLYQAAGFRIVGKRANYYNNPLETGIVMRFLS